MPKNIEDMVPPRKKSIRDLSIPVRRIEPTIMPRQSVEPEVEVLVPRKRRLHRNRNLWVGSVLAVLVLALIGFSLMSGATLAYTPKVTKLAFSGDSYTAYQAATGGQLPYSVIKLSGEKSQTVPASGEETAEVKAKGTVVIYNQQEASQKLVKTTRLETADGKIYRIQNDVTIPAKGSIETVAVAAEPGSAYNIPLSDFTVPGFKGSPRFESVYARSKTPMTGGFAGARKKASDADTAKAKTTLDEELKSELLSQARAQMPLDYVLFPGLASVTYEILPADVTDQSSASVKERGNLSAAIFKRSDLAQYLALQKLGSQNVGSAVEIPDFGKLDVNFSGTSLTDLSRGGPIRIQISGTADLRFVTDQEALIADLVGVQKTDVDKILKHYPSIESARTMVKPFWKSAFPSDATKIKIVAEQ